LTMKGNPLKQLALVLLLLGAVFPVVLMVMRHTIVPGKGVAKHPTAEEPQRLGGTLVVKAAPPPRSLSVTEQGKELLQGVVPATGGEYRTPASLPSGTDLLVTARWDDELPHALRVEFRPAGHFKPEGRDFWAGRELRDVMTLSSPAAR